MRLRLCLPLVLPAIALAQTYSTGGDNTLAALIEQTLAKNPQIQAQFSEYQAALTRAPQVSALPDPMLSFTQHARTPETRVGPQTTVVTLSQRFPWFGKLSGQAGIAVKEAAAQAAMYEARRAEAILQTKLAYFEMGYIDRALAITREQELLLQHYEELAQARYTQGVGPQQDAIKLQAEITRVLSRRQELLLQRVDAEAVLNALRDQPSDTPIVVATLPTPSVVTVETDNLTTIARENRPEVRAAFFGIESREKAIDLARRQSRPDVTVGASWGNVLRRRDAPGRMNPPPGNGKDVYSLSVGMNLPVFRSKYNAGVQEAAERFSAARHSYRGVINEVELSVRSVGFRLRTTGEQIALFERALLPQAEQALRSGEDAYAAGTSGILDLLDSERTLLDARLGLARLETDYRKSLAEMERAIGRAFPEDTP